MPQFDDKFKELMQLDETMFDIYQANGIFPIEAKQ